jgi:GxxExxY protein
MNPEIENIASPIIDAAVKIHTALGPGLLESVYQRCLIHELRNRRLNVESEVPIPIRYDGMLIDAGYRIDVRVEECIIIENKTVDSIQPIHQARLLTYLKLSECPLGFLINWKTRRIKDGIQRMIGRHD